MTHLIRFGVAIIIAIAAFLVFRSLVLQGRLSLPELALRPIMQETNLSEWANRSPQYGNSLGCRGSDCHQDIYDAWATAAHGSVGCETCHGPTLAHSENTNISVRIDRQECNLCHARLAGRPPNFPQVDPANHYSETTCTSCHKAHRPGPASSIPHEVFEGSDCLSCHGASGPPDLAVPANHSGRNSEECLSCHEAAQ